MEWVLRLWLGGLVLLLLSLAPPTFHYIHTKRAFNQFTNLPTTDFRPPLTIVLPMRNESSNVVRKIEEVISMSYPEDRLSILVIDSGSVDGTARLAYECLNSQCDSMGWAVHELDIAGKSLAVNAALDLISTEFFVMMDADAHCSPDSLGKLVDRFSDPVIGAVCGQLSPDGDELDLPYRSRYNIVRVGESIIDSTPIFEGSICAFRVEALSGARINEKVNADDSQLAIIVRSNGYRAVMDPDISFTESNYSPSRNRRIRRAQGLSRVLFGFRRLAFESGAFGSIMRNSLFFYLIMPWLTAIAIVTITLAGINLQFGTNGGFSIFMTVTAIFWFITMMTKIGRSFALGVLALLEAHLYLAFGRKLNVWNPNR